MKKQSGFSVVEGLVIVLVIAVVGFGGWYVWSQNNDDTQSNDTVTSISSYEECAAAGYPILESYPEQCSVPDGPTFTRELTVEEQNTPEPSEDPQEIVIPEGWIKYNEQVFGLGFLVPEEWSAEIIPEGYDAETNTDYRNTIYLKSSDYALENPDGPKPTVIAGQKITINRSENYYALNGIKPSNVSELKEILVEEPLINYVRTTPVEIKIDSRDALYYECGHNKSRFCYDLLIGSNDLVTIIAEPISDESKEISETFIENLSVI